MEFFRDFEDIGKDIVLLKIKILGQYSGIGVLVRWFNVEAGTP